MEQRERWIAARRSLITDGYTVLPGVFRHDEMANLREIILRHLKGQKEGCGSNFGRVEPLAALEMPEIRAVIVDDRILDAIRGLLCTMSPEFLFHCDAHWNDLSGWHKDTGETNFADGYFGQQTFDLQECIVLKLAIYCEDHISDDAGLHVRPGSHRYSDIERGEDLAISSRAGDVIAFDVRITHMGVRREPRYRRIDATTNLLPQRLRYKAGNVLAQIDSKIRSPRLDRTSLFFSYGAKGVEGRLTESFARRNWERACRQAKRSFDFPTGLAEAFSLLGVEVAPIH